MSLDQSETRSDWDTQPNVVHITLSRRWLGALVASLILPWVAVLAVVAFYASRPNTSADRPTARDASDSLRHTAPGVSERETARPGPWGDLESTSIVISPPIENISELDRRMIGNPWFFPHLDEKQLRQFLAQTDLSDELRERIIKLAKPSGPPDDGMIVMPDVELVRALSPEARRRIYSFLAGSGKNWDQINAMRFCGKSADEWFAGSGLARSTTDLVKPLIYRQGRYLFFADFDEVANALPDEKERGRLLKALGRASTLLVNVNIEPGADIEELVRYWGRGGRETEVRPILEAVANGHAGGTVSVVLLLPPFARRRAYTYPAPSSNPESKLRDCHWHALNFFNQDPDDRFANPAQMAEEIQNNYRPIFGNPQLGDLVLFFDKDEHLIHSAVYIADNILFTKNGSRSGDPSMFIRLDDMKEFYPQPDGLIVQYRRRKDL